MLVLITGGVRSGKSRWGEDLCLEINPEAKMAYIATMFRDETDREAIARIEKHRGERAGKGFDTYERFTDLKSLEIFGYGTAILECIPNALANEMFGEGGAGAEKACREIIDGVENLNRLVENLIVITNEVSSEGMTYEKETGEYVRLLSKINCDLALKADRVYETVCGIPVTLKHKARIRDSIFLAFSMFSKIPVPCVKWEKPSMAYALAALPLIGLIVGAAQLLWFYAAAYLGMNLFVYAGVATALPIVITGGIHLDGFLDTADGLSSYGDREKKLAILKDPHVGAFGVMACVLYLLLTFSLWTQIASLGVFGILFASLGFPVSRVLGAGASLVISPAKPSGLGKTFREGAEVKGSLKWLTGAALLLAADMLWINAAIGAVMITTFGLLALWHRKFICGKFGGMTGDLAGHLIQCGELLALGVTVLTPALMEWWFMR